MPVWHTCWNVNGYWVEVWWVTIWNLYIKIRIKFSTCESLLLIFFLTSLYYTLKANKNSQFKKAFVTSFLTLFCIYQSTQCNNPEDYNIHLADWVESYYLHVQKLLVTNSTEWPNNPGQHVSENWKMLYVKTSALVWGIIISNAVYLESISILYSHTG
jgi:hypothetical protein